VQEVQVVAAARENVPEAHVEHVARPDDDVLLPAAHEKQAVAMDEDPYWPGQKKGLEV